MAVQIPDEVEGYWFLMGSSEWNISEKYPLRSDIEALLGYEGFTRLLLNDIPIMSNDIEDIEYLNNYEESKIVRREEITLTTSWIPIVGNTPRQGSIYDFDDAGNPVHYYFGRQNSLYDLAGGKQEDVGGSIANPLDMVSNEYLFLRSVVGAGTGTVSNNIQPVPLDVYRPYDDGIVTGAPIPSGQQERVLPVRLISQDVEREGGYIKYNFTFKARFANADI